MATYHRVILKLSGEALGVDGHGFCHEKFEEAARMLIDVQKTGVELAVVIGGGTVGCELTIQLHTLGKEVDLVEMGDELMEVVSNA